jgi:hypothetical protein
MHQPGDRRTIVLAGEKHQMAVSAAWMAISAVCVAVSAGPLMHQGLVGSAQTVGEESRLRVLARRRSLVSMGSSIVMIFFSLVGRYVFAAQLRVFAASRRAGPHSTIQPADRR